MRTIRTLFSDRRPIDRPIEPGIFDVLLLIVRFPEIVSRERYADAEPRIKAFDEMYLQLASIPEDPVHAARRNNAATPETEELSALYALAERIGR